MSNSRQGKAGAFEDDLTEDEVNYSKEVGKLLTSVSWANNLLKENKINKALKVQKDPNRSYSKLSEIKSALFEVRFAYAVHNVNLTAEYEYKTGQGNSSVDFKLNSKPEWLIELTSLRESDAVKQSTIQDGYVFSYVSVSNRQHNSATVLDIIKVQNAICKKVANKNSDPIKFPDSGSAFYNMIVVDLRAFNAGVVDFYDYVNIAYGSKVLNGDKEPYRMDWLDKNGSSQLIVGLFDRSHPDPISNIIRDKIHALGFICEKKYEDGEFLKELKVFWNPQLFDDYDQFKLIYPSELKAN